MQPWTSLLTDPGPVAAIFGAAVPSLDAIDLHEVIFHRDGPQLTLRFDLADFPASPPAKWRAQQANRVQVRLVALWLESFEVRDLGRLNTLDLSVSREGEFIRLAAGSSVRAVARYLYIESISAYHLQQ